MTTRLDDVQAGAFLRKLESIETEVQREEYAELPFANGDLVPLDEKNEPWARTVTYRKINSVGRFSLQRSYGTSIPMINTLADEFTLPVHKWAAGYYISDDDIEAYQHDGTVNIEQEDIASVREASEQELNQLIAFGDPKLKLPGFVNHPDALYSFSPYALNSSSTPQQILAVLHDSVTAIVKLTKQVEKPDTLLLPVDEFHYCSNTQVSDHLNTTILEQFLKSSPYIKDIESVNEMANAGPDGNSIMQIYKRDSKKVKARIMQKLTWKEMQRKGLGYERPAVFKFGGVVAYRPYSMHVVTLPATTAA